MIDTKTVQELCWKLTTKIKSYNQGFFKKSSDAGKNENDFELLA